MQKIKLETIAGAGNPSQLNDQSAVATSHTSIRISPQGAQKKLGSLTNVVWFRNFHSFKTMSHVKI